MHLAKRVWKQRNAALNLFKPNALARGCFCQKGGELLSNSPTGPDRLTSDLLQPSTVTLKPPPFSSFSSFSLPTSKTNSLGCHLFSWPLLASFCRVWLNPEVLILVLAIHFNPIIFASASIVLATALAAMGHRPVCSKGQHRQQAEDCILRAGTSASDIRQEHCSVYLMDISRSAALPLWASGSLGVQHPPGTSRNSCKQT